MKQLLIGMAAWLLALGAVASGGDAPKEGVNYIEVPRLYANFGDPNRKQFVQIDVSLRTESAESATTVKHHLPLIRDRLLRVVSQQSEDVLSSTEGRELLRSAVLKVLNEAISSVDQGSEASPATWVSDVYFTNFVMQR